MTNAKERIADYKRRLTAITERRKEHKEEARLIKIEAGLKKEFEREEKKFIREEKFRLKHPKLYKTKKIFSGGLRGVIKVEKIGLRKLFASSTTSKKRKTQSRKLRM